MSGGELPSRAALTRLTAGIGDRRRNRHLNDVPPVPELVLVLCQPLYGAIVGPLADGRQEKSQTAGVSGRALCSLLLTVEGISARCHQ